MNTYSKTNMHGIPSGKKFETAAEPSKSGMFERSVGMFGNKQREVPTRNPKQPHLNLPVGTHTHAEARDAVHEANGEKPSFDYAGCMTNKPSPSDTPKSRANQNMRKADVPSSWSAEQATNAPKG